MAEELKPLDPTKIEDARALAAQAWCEPTTERTEMDVYLAEEFALILHRECTQRTALIDKLAKALDQAVDDKIWMSGGANFAEDAPKYWPEVQGRIGDAMKLLKRVKD